MGTHRSVSTEDDSDNKFLIRGHSSVNPRNQPGRSNPSRKRNDSSIQCQSLTNLPRFTNITIQCQSTTNPTSNVNPLPICQSKTNPPILEQYPANLPNQCQPVNPLPTSQFSVNPWAIYQFNANLPIQCQSDNLWPIQCQSLANHPIHPSIRRQFCTILCQSMIVPQI